MECKEYHCPTKEELIKYWNISRMECKVFQDTFKLYFCFYIGIYPEWNVKPVNKNLLHLDVRLEYIQNGM